MKTQEGTGQYDARAHPSRTDRINIEYALVHPRAQPSGRANPACHAGFAASTAGTTQEALQRLQSDAPSAGEGPHSRDSAPAPHRSSAVPSELLTAPPLDGTDETEARELEVGLELGLGPELVSCAELLSGEAEMLVCGAVPLDASGVGVPLSAGPGVPAVPPPTEVPLPGSFLTTAATGLPMISSTAVTVTIARANTRPVARAYFFQPMDPRAEPPR